MAVSTRGTEVVEDAVADQRSGAAASKQHRSLRGRAPHKWVYRFDEGSASMRDLLGGKGAGVAEMTRAGLPVPPGFTITTEACNAFYARGAKFPEGLWEQVEKSLQGCREDHRQGLRRSAQSAAGQRAQRCQVLDAGDDGHGPQPRPQRGDARGSRRAHQ